MSFFGVEVIEKLIKTVIENNKGSRKHMGSVTVFDFKLIFVQISAESSIGFQHTVDYVYEFSRYSADNSFLTIPRSARRSPNCLSVGLCLRATKPGMYMADRS